MDATDMRYLELLSRLFPSADKASAEIINLSAILNLPKGTEFFASDIHGEYEAFSHTLRNGSGSIRLKIDDVFGDSLSENEKRSLATLIYYPREKMELVLSQVDDAEAWYAVTLQRLVAVCKRAAQKYTRSRVRKALPKDFAYIIEELMTENRHGVDKQAYYAAIVDAVIRTDRAARSSRRCACSSSAWLSSACTSSATSTTAGRIRTSSWTRSWSTTPSTSSGATTTSCGWAPRSASAAASRTSCATARATAICPSWRTPTASTSCPWPRSRSRRTRTTRASPSASRQPGPPAAGAGDERQDPEAMAIIQFKVEAQLIDENPGFGLEGRKLLDKIDYERGT